MLLFVAALALAGCASTKEQPPQESRLIPAADAMIVPPPGGPGIVSVSSTTFVNAVRQDIYLATQAKTAGENKISIVRFVAKGGDGSGSALRDIPFTQINLTQEALAAWPDTGMAVSPYYVQNDYGPFGYAIGRPANGDTCIYSWQRIEPSLKPSGAVERGAITIRLQLCKTMATEMELLEVMYRLRIKESVHGPGAAPGAIGRIAAPIRPVGVEGFSNVIDVPAAAPPPIRPAATPPAAGAALPPPSPLAPKGPMVPSPTNTSGGRVTVPGPPAPVVTVPSPPRTPSP